MLRTHNCGKLSKNDFGKTVKLAGWVHSRRDHGGIIFIDLRDRYGVTQIAFDPKISKTAWKEADKVRSEWVIQVEGKVVVRPEDMVNPKLSTGEIEVDCAKIIIHSQSKTPPFEIELDKNKEPEVREDIRLKYRYIDLRAPRLQKIIQDRDRIITYMREYLHKFDFTEVQTPILANSSPEGARDYLVPSRIHSGKFYALPQAPQQFKQLLMVAGLDKYFQIAPCFRDEDPRADRHPGDFYQLDLEMSFVNQSDIFEMIEPLMTKLTEKFSSKKIVQFPFPKITWREVMTKYGSDKPDLRYNTAIKPITKVVSGCSFSVFAKEVENKGVVHAMNVSGGGKFSRSQIDTLTKIAQENGAKGLAYIVLKENGEFQSPIIKFLGEELTKKIIAETGSKKGDIIFFGADKWEIVCKSLGAVRSEVGNLLGLKEKNKAAWLWITDYPLYEMNKETGKVDFSHNPFSMPQGGMKDLEEKNPLEVYAFQYDLVCNGLEISSGAIRNHSPEIMYKAFEIAGYSKEDVDEKFGHMINAFSYGAPPHGGIAPGIDRLMMILWDLENIRDIYAFPKSGSGQDLMLSSPSAVSKKQLRELKIKFDLDLK